MNSTIIAYHQSLNAFGSPDGNIVINPPLDLPVRAIKKVRLLRASISSAIPNIFQVGTFNNGLVRCSRDAGVTWVNIQLPNGIYTTHFIQKGINETLEDLGWWIDNTDPGILIEYNLATQLPYIELVSSKLAVPGTQLAIDLSVSSIHTVLGFQATQVFNVDGLFGADQPAQLDWTGNNISVLVNGIGGLSYQNGAASSEICKIPLGISSTTTNEYIFPLAGIQTPYLNATIPSRLQNFSFQFKGSRFDVVSGSIVQRPVYLLDGEVVVELELTW